MPIHGIFGAPGGAKTGPNQHSGALAAALAQESGAKPLIGGSNSTEIGFRDDKTAAWLANWRLFLESRGCWPAVNRAAGWPQDNFYRFYLFDDF
jgi:hypothetical protein